MEENLTLAELETLLEAKRDADFQQNKFTAALKGIDLEEPQSDAPTFDDIKRRAEAKNRGVSTEVLEFAEIGIGIEGDD
ncbi:hypothetical protein SEA_DAUBENSKI_59 [Streptomyces phage Daubenski]|uniref:Tail assembly chaperone n=1 Tax=Streptomyces phage Daubenski TaxID=2653725 RepID=A0A5Q2WII6_9CAUD|nr:hypothetical protein KNU80_gp207 [Streptomyces phage Daubenski]QGH76367.1 hypothetical protein SEA_DAUBENSKI_59 [Streptomyces phage Daubenski]